MAQSAQPWYDYAIPAAGSHAAGDDGDDIDAPDNTPVWFPFGGRVIDASYHDYGGQVVVDVPGTGYSEYDIHLNDVYVQPGQDIAPGQIIGTSGGGVGDKVLHNGRVQPAQSQSWYDGHSSGYHFETGYFQGENMHDFNQGWGNHSRQLDPTGVLQALQNGLEPHWPGSAQPTLAVNANPSPPGAIGIPGVQINAGEWPDDIAKALGFINARDGMTRLAASGVGIAAILLAVFVALQPEGATLIKTAAKVA